MGEVYRAHDGKLDQLVALKFLPAAIAQDVGVLARFHNEVRVARQVSHPNVCRVYDIGDVDGLNFISMEFVDGEDLRSLLRRIGRLPADKALEIARKLCAALAAAHDKGVLHRDLKPANVMINSLGQVLVTDFGLAVLAGQLQGTDVRSGTPAYMSPEQIDGKEVTARSDIYALGLVFYEMFTGKRAFESASRDDLPPQPSQLVKDMDPAVERVILHCLDPDPKRRPATALAVAAALPGGDPLAAALAAGETPSPEMVAAAGETEGLPVRVAVIYLAVVMIGLFLAAFLRPRVELLNKVPLPTPPEGLAQKAREFINQFGYTDPPADTAFDFESDPSYLAYAEKHDSSPNRWDRLATGQPAVMQFWYRQSPRYLEPLLDYAADIPGRVSAANPPMSVSGMVTVNLDPQGRLIRFEAVPPQVERSPTAPRPFDWNLLFAAAGLDPARFQSAEPQWLPPTPFDARAAWTGSYPDGPELRLEAAAWRGRPVYFQVIGPWTRPDRVRPQEVTRGQKMGNLIIAGLFILILVGSMLLARRHARLGRGDRRGAIRLGAFIFFFSLLGWLLTYSHTPTFWLLDSFVTGLSRALIVAGFVWLMYMALEPYVRRRWPHILISWSRILSGRIRDPLVGGDLLVGVMMGLIVNTVLLIRLGVLDILKAQPRMLTDGLTLMGTRGAAGSLLADVPRSVLFALFLFFALFLLRTLLRRPWLAAGAYVLMFAAMGALAQPSHQGIHLPFAILIHGLSLFTLLRFGLTASVTAAVGSRILSAFPLTLDFSAWYFGASLMAMLSILALAAYGFHTTLAGRPLVKDDLLGA